MEVRVSNRSINIPDELYMNYRSHQKILVVDGEVSLPVDLILQMNMQTLSNALEWKDASVRLKRASCGILRLFLQM